MANTWGLITALLAVGASVVDASTPYQSDALLAKNHVALNGKWKSTYEKSSTFVKQLTNEEKVLLVTGQNIPSVNWTALSNEDGSQGLENYFQVSGFLLPSALVMTWDKDLIKRQFKALGTEMYQKGFQLINAPTVNPQGRTPWSGRLVETLGQDAYLSGIAFGLATKAMVEAGVIPGGKHFLLNEQETNRTDVVFDDRGNGIPRGLPAYSSNADDKTIHEAYMWPFYDAVKSGLGAVMCAMNRVNGSYSCENDFLLNHLLKTELQFPGMVYPDITAQHNALLAANGGSDYGGVDLWNNTLLEAMTNGSFTQERLDDMATRTVMGYFYADMDNGKQPSLASVTALDRDVRANHKELIRKAGSESIVLLKNVNNALPLSKPKSIAFFGANAKPIVLGPAHTFDLVDHPETYDGHLIYSGGSGSESPSYVITPYDMLTQKSLADGTQLMWIMNDTLATRDYVAGIPPSGTFAIPTFGGYAAVNHDVCLIFINAWSGEQHDRGALYNKDQDAMIKEVADNCNNTIVSITAAGARLVDQWIDHPNVTAVIYSSLLGEQSAQALFDVLYGKVNPSGRLAYTIAKNESEYPVSVCYTADCDFTEGVFMDYKYFDQYNITPRYEFGFGLSYTNFSISDLSIVHFDHKSTLDRYPQGAITVGGAEDLWDTVLTVSVNVTNTGLVDGSEVVQLYLAYPDEAQEPIRQLRGFEKISLQAGKSGLVTIDLRRRDMSYWDTTAQKWAIAKGEYELHAGASSRDLRTSVKLTI